MTLNKFVSKLFFLQIDKDIPTHVFFLDFVEGKNYISPFLGERSHRNAAEPLCLRKMEDIYLNLLQILRLK